MRGDERVPDNGCCDGRISAQIAARVPRGSVLGTDASAEMIARAATVWNGAVPGGRRNLRFEGVDARALP